MLNQIRQWENSSLPHSSNLFFQKTHKLSVVVHLPISGLLREVEVSYCAVMRITGFCKII